MAVVDNILVGKKTELRKIDKGLGEYFFEKVDTFGDTTFQIDALTDEKQSFRHVLQRSTRVAMSLSKSGLKPNDIVMLCCWSDLNNIVPWFAAVFMGAVICSLDPYMSASDINIIVASVQPIKVLFVAEEMLETMQAALKLGTSSPTIIVIGEISGNYLKMSDMEKESPFAEEQTFKPLKVDVNETAFILLSSGTTGTAKAVCLSQYRFMDWALSFENSGLNGAIVQKISMYWVSAVFTTYQVVATGACKVLAREYSPLMFVESLSKFKVQIALCSDGSYYAILDILEKSLAKFDLSSLAVFYLGGSVIEKDLILKFRTLLPQTTKVLNLYGSTETGSLTYFPPNDPKAYDEKVNSIGVVKDNIEIKFANLKSGDAVGPNVVGEMCVKSPFIMKRYYNIDNPNVYDKNGYFKSGDLGYFDEDGYVYITDRINESFQIHYQNQYFTISPSSIREVILKHHDVFNAVVFNTPHEEELNRISAFIVLKEDAKAGSEDILKFTNEKLPESQRIRGYLKINSELPRTVTDKVSKRYLKNCGCSKQKK